MVELAENLHRNDLTKEERKVMVLRYDQLLHNGNKSPAEKRSQGRKGESGWFVLYVDKLGNREAYKMWDEFKTATGLDFSPSWLEVGCVRRRTPV